MNVLLYRAKLKLSIVIFNHYHIVSFMLTYLTVLSHLNCLTGKQNVFQFIGASYADFELLVKLELM